MREPLTLREAYDKVADLIPDYDWETAFKGGDLIHIPTKISVSSDIDGYEMHQSGGRVPMWDYEVGDFVRNTTNPNVAASAFVIAVITELIQQRLENNR